MFKYLASNIPARLVKPKPGSLEICQTQMKLYKVKYLICCSLQLSFSPKLFLGRGESNGATHIVIEYFKDVRTAHTPLLNVGTVKRDVIRVRSEFRCSFAGFQRN